MVRLVVVNENALDNPATPPSLNHLITKDISYQRQGGELGAGGGDGEAQQVFSQQGQ